MSKKLPREIARTKYRIPIPNWKFILDIVILDTGERLITEESLLKYLEVATCIDGYDAFEHIGRFK